MDRLQDIMPANLSFGDAVKVHGLGMLPIINDAVPGNVPALLTLDEALDGGAITIREVDEAGSVPFLLVENHGDKPVLILDGEEVVGGKQNRILNSTVIVLEHHSVRVCVSCVQQGRWNGSGDFLSSKAIFNASSRSIHKRGVSENLRRQGMPVSNQGAVWNEVEKTLRQHGVHSRTADFQEARQMVSHQIEEFVEALEPTPSQVGAVFFGSRGVIGAEYLHTPDLFSRCNGKIVRSFAFEVLSSPSLNGLPPDPAKAWWADMLQSPISKHNSVGVGDDIRTESIDMAGSGLLYGGVTIHFSGFPDLRLKEDRPNGRRLPVRDRRRNLRSTLAE